MAVSKARKRFRRFLLILLVFSASFFTLSAFFYASVKQHKIPLSALAPTLFQIDVYHYYARSYLTNKDGQHDIAIELLDRAFFSPLYYEAGSTMLASLADNGHPPSQVTQGDILMNTYPLQENRKKALHYYETAAAQDYQPALDRLDMISKLK